MNGINAITCTEGLGGKAAYICILQLVGLWWCSIFRMTSIITWQNKLMSCSMHTRTDCTTNRNTLLTECNIQKPSGILLQRKSGSHCDKLGGVFHYGNCKAWNCMNLLQDTCTHSCTHLQAVMLTCTLNYKYMRNQDSTMKWQKQCNQLASAKL
jgi:hypothetical protein